MHTTVPGQVYGSDMDLLASVPPHSWAQPYMLKHQLNLVLVSIYTPICLLVAVCKKTMQDKSPGTHLQHGHDRKISHLGAQCGTWTAASCGQLFFPHKCLSPTACAARYIIDVMHQVVI